MPERQEEDQAVGSAGGGQEKTCAVITELLPFYLNQSLDEDETRRVEAHLLTCAACRQEERDTRTTWALYEGHLPVEILLDYALSPSMAAPSRTVVESHLAVCERCSEEVATVRQTASGQQDSNAAVAEPPLRWPKPADPLASLRQSHSRLRALAWAACLATAIGSAGWIWTWRQLVAERPHSPAPMARANLSVVELLPATLPLLRHGKADPQATANPVPPPEDADELVLVLLSGDRACESGCNLEIYEAEGAQPKWRVEGLVANPDGHVTLAVPSAWLSPGRSVLALRHPASGERVAEYLIEIQP